MEKWSTWKFFFFPNRTTLIFTWLQSEVVYWLKKSPQGTEGCRPIERTPIEQINLLLFHVHLLLSLSLVSFFSFFIVLQDWRLRIHKALGRSGWLRAAHSRSVPLRRSSRASGISGLQKRSPNCLAYRASGESPSASRVHGDVFTCEHTFWQLSWGWSSERSPARSYYEQSIVKWLQSKTVSRILNLLM
jgi:hypothetical protein